MNVILFGPPGAGKGTQSALMVEKLNMAHISTGDLFRENMKNDTPLGIKAKQYVEKGELVPDEVTIGMVDDALKKLDGKPFILDGFPRNVPQAEALKDLMESNKMSIEKAIFFEVPREVLLGRLTGRRVCKNCGATYHIEFKPTKTEGICDSCGSDQVVQRKDDAEDVIATRLDAYDNSTAPLKEYFQNTGQFVAINGLGSGDEVFAGISNILQ